MTPADALHGITGTWWAFAAAVLASAGLVGASWILGALLAGRGPRLGRGAAAVGLGGFLATGLLLLATLLDTLASGRPGPTAWLDAAVGTPQAGWFGTERLALTLVGLSLLVLPATGVAALSLRRRPPRDRRLPAAVPLGALVGLLAPLIGLAAAWPVLHRVPEGVFGPELYGGLVFACLVAGVALQSADARPGYDTPLEAEAPPDPQRDRPDIVAAWRALGALGEQDAPFFSHGAHHGDGGSEPARRAWAATGAHGPPPEALDDLRRALGEPGHAWVVGDLPHDTETALVVAAMRLGTREHGTRTLVVSDTPERWHAAWRRADEHAGTWPVGSVSRSLDDLRDALSRDQPPVVAFVSTADLARGGLGLLGRSIRDHTPWLADVGLVVLPRVDRGSPVDTTHRTFVLRRLALLLDELGGAWSALATGFGGRGTVRMLQRALPRHATRAVPLRPRASAPVAVWLADYRFLDAPGEPWARRAAEAATGAGHRASVGDPQGAFDETDVAIWGREIPLVRDLTLSGAASVSALDDLWLVAGWRTLGHRLPEPGSPTHHALWGLVDHPVTRFLVEQQHLEKLRKHGRLEPPTPVVGTHNRSLGRAHLQATLQDGTFSRVGLERAFGASLVDEVVGPLPPTGPHTVVRDADGRPVRAPLAPMREGAADPLRATVTERSLTVVDADTGAVLDTVDRLVAPTRYYPRRVFAAAGHRYEVGMHALDDKRDRLVVQRVDDQRPLTVPVLDTTVRPRRQLVSTQRIHSERLAFSLATFDAIVAERVVGLRRGRSAGIDYAPVTASYRTVVLAIGFDTPTSAEARFHLARSLDDVLRSHLLVHDDDVDVVPFDEPLGDGLPAGVMVVDRHVQGMGVAESLDEQTLTSLLGWVWAILHRCSCDRGCRRCSPWEVLDAGTPAKGSVLALLGG